MCEALVEATARVLVTEGFDKATTNRIAKVAGVSVGSLYQYFPNKEALVLAVVDRHMGRVSDLLARLAVELADAPVEQAVRATIAALVEIHGVDPRLHTVIEQQAHHIAHDRIRQLRRGMTGILAAWLSSRDDVAVTDPEAASFVLNVAVRSVTHEGMADGTVDPEAILDELTAMVVRYLKG